MKNGLSPVGKRVKGYFSKEMAEISITVVIFIETVLTSGLIYVGENYEIGYKYYNLDTEIGIVQQEDFLETTITDYLEQLEGEGYTVISSQLTTDIDYEETIVRKDEYKEEAIKDLIVDNLDTTINLTKIVIAEEELPYYFKTKEESENFINSLNEYIKQEYTTEDYNGKIEDITAQEVLEQKLTNVKKEKTEADAARKRMQVASRSGTSKVYNAPMASYVIISSKYGWRSSGWHNGVDFAAPQGTEIYSWKDGTVTFAGWYGNYGYFIIVEHDDGTVSKYAHCSRIAVETEATVTKGQTIGYVGSTGRSTGPHLHLEIQVNEKTVDPLLYL